MNAFLERLDAIDKPNAFLGTGACGTLVFLQLPLPEHDPIFHAWLVAAGFGHMVGVLVSLKIQVLGPDRSSVEEEGKGLVGLQPCKLVLCFGQVEGGNGPKVRVYCLLREFEGVGSLMARGSEHVDEGNIDTWVRFNEGVYREEHTLIPEGSLQFAGVRA